MMDRFIESGTELQVGKWFFFFLVSSIPNVELELTAPRSRAAALPAEPARWPSTMGSKLQIYQ